MKLPTSSEDRKKTFLLLYPIIFIPFIAIFFFALGGGRGEKKEQNDNRSRFNASIPSAQVDDNSPDKLSLYQKAERDSIARSRAEELDPFNKKDQKPDALPEDVLTTSIESPYSNPYRAKIASTGSNHVTRNRNPDAAADEVSRKLADLEKVLNEKEKDSIASPISSPPAPAGIGQIDELEKLLKDNSMGNKSDDPELNQLDGMLEKILDIQHPDRVQEKIKQRSLLNKEEVFAVQKSNDGVKPDVFGEQQNATAGVKVMASGDGFFELGGGMSVIENNAVAAVVHESQTLVSGATVKLRLVEDIYLQGQLIPKGTFIFGSCALAGERLTISIPSIRFKNSIYPVELTAYDLDGLAGVRVPGSISRDASKQGADQAIQAVSMGSLDPSLQAQAAAAGIETAKNLLSKKVKLIKVMVKSDYPVLLKSSR